VYKYLKNKWISHELNNCVYKVENVTKAFYCIGTMTRNLWIHYTDCWIV